MRIALSSDEHVPMLDALIQDLESRGHAVDYIGPRSGEPDQDWPDVSLEAARRVLDGRADEAIVCCWTGTGACMAANKLPGIRAALCGDVETTKGARVWNQANVLALSLRLTSTPQAKEILDAWLETPISEDDWNRAQIAKIAALEAEIAASGKA